MELSTKVEGVVVGRLAGLDGAGPRVEWAGEVVRARATVPIDAGHVGRDVVLAFEEGDPSRPIILGVIHDPSSKPVAASVDGESILIDGRREIVLKCGRASITLTRAGKILLRGTYVLSRSSGVNRIKGGSVQIN